MLILGRVFTGVGEACMVSVVIPYISDHAPDDKKALWIALYYTAAPVGGAAGLVFGYDVAKAFGSWHWPFLMEALAVAFILLVGAFSYKDPSHIVTKDFALLESGVHDTTLSPADGLCT